MGSSSGGGGGDGGVLRGGTANGERQRGFGDFNAAKAQRHPPQSIKLCSMAGCRCVSLLTDVIAGLQSGTCDVGLGSIIISQDRVNEGILVRLPCIIIFAMGQPLPSRPPGNMWGLLSLASGASDLSSPSGPRPPLTNRCPPARPRCLCQFSRAIYATSLGVLVPAEVTGNDGFFMIKPFDGW